MSVRRIVAHRYGMMEPVDPKTPMRLVRASDPVEKTEVFLFFFPRDLGPRHAAVHQELRERGERLQQKPHPLFLNVLKVEEEEGLLFLVEERPRGDTLLSLIRARRRSGDPFPLEEALGICWLLCRAVEAMRPLFGHGFLNPQEVFLEPWEDGPLSWYPKVAHPGFRACLRFGSAAYEGLEEEACRYAAPEFVGREAITEATDFYCIAALLYSMLTLSTPTGCFNPPSGIYPGFPAAVEMAMLRALEEDPGQRRFGSRTLPQTLREHACPGVAWDDLEAAESRLCLFDRPGPTAQAASIAPQVPGRPEPGGDLGGGARLVLHVVSMVLFGLILLGFGIRELHPTRLQGEARLEEFRWWELRFLDHPAGAVPWLPGRAGSMGGHGNGEEDGR